MIFPFTTPKVRRNFEGMKSTLLSAVLPLLGLAGLMEPLAAQYQDPLTPTRIVRVKLYLQGAEVYRSARTELPKGVSEIILGNLSPNINASSIQVSSTNNVAVLSATYRNNYMVPVKLPQQIRVWQDSVAMLETEIRRLETRKNVLEKESEIFLNNRSIGGSQNGVNAAELQKVADLFRVRMNQIREEHFDVVQRMGKLQEQVNKLRNQIAERSGNSSKLTGEIVLQLASEQATATEIECTYLVQNAGWSPLYDLRAEGINQPVRVISKASVYQNSGEEWNQVPLILSTGTPNTSSNLPVLQKNDGFGFRSKNYENYGYEEDVRMQNAPPVQQEMAGVAVMSRTEEDMDDQRQDRLRKSLNTQTLGNLIAVNSSAIAVDYEIALPYTIPADGKIQLVSLKEYALPGNFSYYTIPKLEKSVFLVADVTGWQELNLLPGPANLFFRGSFTGQSQLNLNPETDTLKLSFGKDKKVLTERKLIRNYATRQLVGGKKSMELGYEIQLNNTNKESINLEIRDQIPVSTSEEIRIDEVKFETPNGVKTIQDKESGQLTWKLTLKPAETQKIRVRYRVVYPKELELLGY
jgi:uncharacterized protein (TIGR02231 family)